MRTGFWAFAIALLLALTAVPARAAEPDPAGRWALHAGGRTLLILELRRGPNGAEWTGSFERPTRLQLIGQTFSAIEGPVVRRSVQGRATADGLELIAEGMRAGDTDIYLFRASDEGLGELRFKNVPMEPLVLARAVEGERVAESWPSGRAYSADPPFYPPNPEMARIFTEDQAARTGPGPIDWSRLGPEDSSRRAETRALLDSGKLRSGDDFFHAAFVFQHGGTAEDYLMAHVLATVAVARGRRDATWIAAATLDRYLQAIGRPQVFGTQYMTPPGGTTTQEPYDRTLVSDAVRAAMGVPPQAEHEKERAEIEARARAVPR